MACPHCGEHLLHNHAGRLRCCRCSRLRQDLGPALPLLGLLRSTPILLTMLLAVPVAFGVVAIEGMRSNGSQSNGPSELAQE